MTKGMFRKDAIPGWERAVQIHSSRITELQTELEQEHEKLKDVTAYIKVCKTPPSSRNVLFTHMMTGIAEHFENARSLSYPYVAWNDSVYTVDKVLLGTLEDFGL